MILGFLGMGILSNIPEAAAVNLTVKTGYADQQSTVNADGGFDYLPNGDVVIIRNGIALTPFIYIVDANGDNVPAAPQLIGSMPSGTFSSFIKVSPNGTFAVFGATGSTNPISKINLSTFAITNITSISGNQSLAFLSNNEVLISYNASFSPASPNQIAYLQLSNPSSQRVLADIANTPSGPIALKGGNLYYVKSTWAFPAPPNSHRLLKFPKAKMDQALSTGIILRESDAQLITTLDGGYELAVNEFSDILVTDLSGRVFKVNELTGAKENFCITQNFPNDGSFTHLTFYKRNRFFNPFEKSESKLGTLFADITYSNFTLVQLSPVVSDPWADNIISFQPGQGGSANAALALGAPIGGGTAVPNNSSLVLLGDRDNPTTASPAALTLGFNNSIRDNAQDLYGLDFTAFGNSFWAGGNSQNRFAEPAIMEVSADLNHNGLPDDEWFMINPNTLPANLGPANPVQYNTLTLRGYADYSPTLILGDTDGNNIVNNPNMPPEDFYTVPDRLCVPGDAQSYLVDNNSGGGDSADIRDGVVQTSPGVPLVDFAGRNRFVHLDRVDFVRLRDARNSDIYTGIGLSAADIDAVAATKPKLRGTTTTVSNVSQLIAALAAAVPGDEVIMNPGVYPVTAALVVPRGVSLKGNAGLWTPDDPSDDTVIRGAGLPLGAPAISLSDPAGTFSYEQGYEISGIHFEKLAIGIQIDRLYPAIQYNFFKTASQSVVITNASANKTVIRYNVFGDVRQRPSIGIDADNSKLVIVHNTFVNHSAAAAFFRNNTAEGYLRDNIFYGNQLGVSAANSGYVYGHYNDFFRNGIKANLSASGLMENDVLSKPSFAAEKEGDYRLQVNSPVRTLGMGGADPGVYDGPNFYP